VIIRRYYLSVNEERVGNFALNTQQNCALRSVRSCCCWLWCRLWSQFFIKGIIICTSEVIIACRNFLMQRFCMVWWTEPIHSGARKLRRIRWCYEGMGREIHLWSVIHEERMKDLTIKVEFQKLLLQHWIVSFLGGDTRNHRHFFCWAQFLSLNWSNFHVFLLRVEEGSNAAKNALFGCRV